MIRTGSQTQRKKWRVSLICQCLLSRQYFCWKVPKNMLNEGGYNLKTTRPRSTDIPGPVLSCSINWGISPATCGWHVEYALEIVFRAWMNVSRWNLEGFFFPMLQTFGPFFCHPQMSLIYQNIKNINKECHNAILKIFLHNRPEKHLDFLLCFPWVKVVNVSTATALF